MPRKKNHFEQLKDKLHKKRQSIVKDFHEKHADAVDWLEEKGADFETVKEVAKKGAAASAIGGMLLASPTPIHHRNIENIAITAAKNPGVNENLGHLTKEPTQTGEILDLLFKHLPKDVRKLNVDERDKLAEDLSQELGFKVTGTLNGTEINTNYGKIGQEQLLRRWEGDTASAHADHDVGPTELKHGMAPGKGAWGYFGAPGDKEAIEKEKWYVVGQTWLWPSSNPNKIKELKHQKMVLVNPENGKVVVGVMGDAGPAVWTGKVFGGSPKVMHSLGAVDKSPMIMYFVDDPENKIPLGVVVN